MYSICSLAKGDVKEQIVRFHSGSWSATQQNYNTIQKEILSIILCVSKFQNDLFNQKFLIRVDCKSAKEVLQKDVQNLVSKQSFARWQAILSVFDFDIEYIREKIILGNPFMALLYPFLTTEEGIKTNMLGKDILFKFILPHILKEIYSLTNTSIIKEIDIERIDRKNRHLESLKSKIIYERIAGQLTDPILNHKIKLFRQQIEAEICSNLPTTFWHTHRHIVQAWK